MSSEWKDVSLAEDTGEPIMARIYGNANTAISVASLSSISYSVYRNGSSVDSGTLTVADVVFDTLQTDAAWTVDTTGYNFKWDLPDTICTEPGTYELVITFNPATGGDFKLKVRLNVDGDLSS